MPPQSQEELVFRPYRDGDEKAVLETFNLVFSASRTLPTWNWRFKENPYLPPSLALAWNTQGKVVGQYALIPVLLNVSGRPVLVAQSVDTLVHPDYRNRGLFLDLAHHCYDQCKKLGIKAVFGFPNPAAFPGRVRHLGWRRMGYYNQYLLRLSFSETLKKILRVGLLADFFDLGFRAFRAVQLTAQGFLARLNVPGATYTKSDSIPEGYGALWNEVGSAEILSLWKDEKYLHWRYDRNPDHKFEYHSIRIEGELVAMAVVGFERSVVNICELFVTKHQVQVGRHLILQIAQSFLRRGARRIAFSGYDCGFFSEVFSTFRRQTEFGNVFCGAVLSDKELEPLFYAPQSWNVTVGDTDGF